MKNSVPERRFALLFISLTAFLIPLSADGWRERPDMFNPSGVPSLSFSQPRFADLDGDGDQDLILGNSSDKPHYMTNVGSATAPGYLHMEDIFISVAALDAEMGVFGDIDNDGDLDMVTGGYTGISLYRNTGSVYFPAFEKVPGYFPLFSGVHNPVPDLADLDGDGDLDMVVGFSEDGSVRIYLNSGSDSLAVFSDSHMTLIGDAGLYAYPVFCDLDNDGDMDIVCGKDGHGFIYYQNTGNAQGFVYQANTSMFSGIGDEGYFNSPVMTDMNGDGKADLVFGTASGPLSYYRNTGTASVPAWTRNTTLFGGVIDIGGASNPFFIDYDHDGDMDLATGSQMGDVKYIENIGTARVPSWKASRTFTPLKHSIYSFVTLGDVNNDGYADALVGDLSGNIYLHFHTGTAFSSTPATLFALGGWSCPRFIDMDRDGDLDIAAGNEDGLLYYYENSGSAGSPVWGEIYGYFGGLDVGSDAVPAFADIDFDGDYDLVTGNAWRELRYFENRDGVWVEDTTVVEGIVGGQNCAPAFADLDGDGDQDLILGDYGGTFAYYENTRPVVALAEKNLLPERFGLENYPNPFNPSTTVRYRLSADSRVSLSLYDLSGKLILLLPDDDKTAGVHSLNLSAPDGMSGGIYILQLQVNGTLAESRKITLLK